MKLGSLCTGYGGLDLAADALLGTETVWLSEIDKNASRICDVRFPGVPNLGDLTVIDWTQVEPVDVLTAGYPCQPFSTAGRRLGADDARHIWPFVLDAVRVLRPGLVLLENVAGHLALGFDRVLGDLAAVGFDAEWSVVRASEVGACHRRARLFVVAADPSSAARRGPQQQAVPAATGSAPEPGEHRRPDTRDGGALDAAAGEGRSRQGLRVLRATVHAEAVRRPTGGPDEVPGASALLAGVRQHTDRGDEGRPALASSQDAWSGVRDVRDGRAAARPPQGPQPGEQRAGEPGDALWVMPPQAALAGGPCCTDGGCRWGEYGPAVHRHERLVGRKSPAPTDGSGRLSARFVEFMMCLPAGWVTDILPRNPALKALGNGVVPPQAAYAISHLLERHEAAERAA